MIDIASHWEEIKQYIGEEYDIKGVRFNTWIAPLEFYKFENDVVTVVTSSSQSKDYLNKKYSELIKNGISEYIEKIISIEIITENEKNSNTSKKEDSDEIKQNNDYIESHLDDKFTFESYVVSSNNSMAFNAALAVAESPGEDESYNPLFIYGDSGLGKSHLMNAIGNYNYQNNLNKKVLYVTCQEFIAEVVESIRTSNSNPTAMKSFRDKYNNIDILLLDDIQFIKTAEATQEQFFNIFNNLKKNKKQIVITSDIAPSKMEYLEQRYTSRFNEGLPVDIKQPNYETRVAILEKKRNKLNDTDKIYITDEIIEYISKNISSNVRDLVGGFNKVLHYSKLNKNIITMNQVAETLKDIISPEETTVITPEDIFDIVKDHFNLDSDEICSKKRSKDITRPRHIIMYLCRTYTDAPLKNIALLCGKGDHSTVINAVNNISEEIKKNKDLENTINVLKKKLNIN